MPEEEGPQTRRHAVIVTQIRAAIRGDCGCDDVGIDAMWSGVTSLMAAAAALGIWSGERGADRARSAVAILMMGGLLWSARRRIGVRGTGSDSTPIIARPWDTRSACALLVLVLAITGYLRSDRAWMAVSRVAPGPFRGEAVLRADPIRKGRAVRVVLELDGRRYDVLAYGPAATRLSGHRFGETVRAEGMRVPFPDGTARRRHLNHVVGRFEVRALGSSEAGSLSRASPIVRAAHRVRNLLSRGARTLGAQDQALFAGLVYGDDSAQSPEMIARFRRSGLAHLTAVSGQNVAYVLAMASPLLTRLRRPLRWAATMAVLVWFVVLTRLEPSVLRAGLMAAVSATVFALGRRATAWQVLGIAATLGLLLDPFLLWSVGWWLSVSGAAGLIVLTPALSAGRTDGVRPRWSWMAPMAAAQIGVLPVSTMVFGVPSALAIPANLLAVPVAGVVMLIGLPIALVAAWIPTGPARILMWPLSLGVRWVDGVAALGDRVRPPSVIDWCAAAALLVWAVLRHRRRVPT